MADLQFVPEENVQTVNTLVETYFPDQDQSLFPLASETTTVDEMESSLLTEFDTNENGLFDTSDIPFETAQAWQEFVVDIYPLFPRRFAADYDKYVEDFPSGIDTGHEFLGNTLQTEDYYHEERVSYEDHRDNPLSLPGLDECPVVEVWKDNEGNIIKALSGSNFYVFSLDRPTCTIPGVDEDVLCNDGASIYLNPDGTCIRVECREYHRNTFGDIFTTTESTYGPTGSEITFSKIDEKSYYAAGGYFE